MNASHTLREAAARLRELAAKAVEGPWIYSRGSHRNDYDKAEVVAENGGWILATANLVDDENFRWIAAMSPAVAEPLAGWLDEAASIAEIIRQSGDQDYTTSAHAIAFARQILGDSDAG